MTSTGGWWSSWLVFFLSLLLVAVVKTSALPQLPSTIVNCIEVDLNEIEELRLNFQNRLPLEQIEDEAFGLDKRDWLRLKSLEETLPSDSKLKSKLTKAFRILIYALYEAHGQYIHANNETMPGNPNTDPVDIDTTSQKVTTTHDGNNTFAEQGESSDVKEVVVSPVSPSPPYNGTEQDEDQSTAGEEESDTGPRRTEEGGTFDTETSSFNDNTASYDGNSEEKSSQSSTPSITEDDSDYSHEYEPQNNHSSKALNYNKSSTVKVDDLPKVMNVSSNPEKTKNPLITTVVYEDDDDDDSSIPPVTIDNKNNGIFNDNTTQQSPNTTINQVKTDTVSDNPIEGPKKKENDTTYTTPDDVTIDNKNNGIFNDNTTQQSPNTTINQVKTDTVSDNPIEGPKKKENYTTYTTPDVVYENNGTFTTITSVDVPEDTTTYRSDTTCSTDHYSTEQPNEKPKINRSEIGSSTQEDISTGTTENLNWFNVILKKREKHSKETQELKELKIFPSSGHLVEEAEVKNTGSKGGCVNVGNLKFRDDIYSGSSILNKVFNRISKFVNDDKDINTDLEDNSMWIYKMKTLKKERT